MSAEVYEAVKGKPEGLDDNLMAIAFEPTGEGLHLQCCAFFDPQAESLAVITVEQTELGPGIHLCCRCDGSSAVA